MANRETLSENRRLYLRRVETNSSPEYLEKLKLLEQKFGKYLFLPLDIPNPKIDTAAFVKWYNDNAVLTRKIQNDIAGPATDFPIFKTIDVNNSGRIWTNNLHPEIYELFPGIKEYVKSLPIFDEHPPISIWSSVEVVLKHRDETFYSDLPNSFRCMLYDENPNSTLMITEDPIDGVKGKKPTFIVPRVESTNSFSWNNLRIQHSSVYAKRQKILLIAHPYSMDLDRVEDLFQRSIDKYSSHAKVSKLPISAFSSD